MFTSLRQTISSHPSPTSLRKDLREHLYDALARIVVPRGDPQAVRAYATRELAELDADAEADVDVIRDANEQLLAAVEREAEKGKGDGNARAYVSFLEEWCSERQNVDIYLVSKRGRTNYLHPCLVWVDPQWLIAFALSLPQRRYLISSLHALIRRLEKRSVALSPALLAAHLKLATHTEVGIEHVQRLAKKYTGKAPGREAADVWLARLQLMRLMGLDDKEVWLEAKGCVQGEGEAEVKVWMWGLENQEDRVVWRVREFHSPSVYYFPHSVIQQDILKESMSLGLGKVHEEALIGYATLLMRAHEKDIVRHLTLAYLPTPRVWSHVYREGTRSGHGGTGFLGEVFEMWKREDQSSARREMEDLGR
jgi:hypothetical protein